MVILYFDNEYHQYYHYKYYLVWSDYSNYRPNESSWLVPGTDPDDCFWC